MVQSLTLTTPSAVVTRKKKFPKQGVYNLKITRNGVFDTVDLWIRRPPTTAPAIQLDGAVFVSTQTVASPKTAPINPTSITGTTFNVPAGIKYIKIKLDEGVDVAYLRFDYTFKSPFTLLSSGNPESSALIEYGKKPYVADNFWLMFANDPIRGDITNWDVSSATDLTGMFSNNIRFNQPIGKWDMSNATIMGSFLSGAAYFNQPLASWNVSKVTNMASLFSGAASFNQPIGNWDVREVTNMFDMFKGARSFNQPLASWDISKVTNLVGMFSGALAFNQPLVAWNVSKVTNTSSMFFGAASFNQPIGSWDISKVINMFSMFFGATSFQQDLSPWAAKFNIDVELGNFFFQNKWNTVNYDNFLIALALDINTTRAAAWATRTTAKVLGMGTSKYSTAGAAARASLVAKGWTITDGGLEA